MSNPKRFIAIVIVTVGLATVISQIAVVMTVNGMVGYGQVKAVSGVVMPTVSSQAVPPSLYSQAALERLRTGRAQLPPLEERLLATGELFAVPEKGDTDRVHQEVDPRTARMQLGS